MPHASSRSRRSFAARGPALHPFRGPLGSVVALALVLALELPVLVGLSTAPAAATEVAASVAGTVVGPDGAPVAAATVSVIEVVHDDDLAFRTPEVVAAATTGVDGTYAVVEEVGPGAWGLVVTPAADDPALLAAASREIWIEEEVPLVEDVDLVVSTLRGTVTSSDGAPAAGALVEAGPDQWAEGFALTATDGTYRLAPPAGSALVAAYPPVVNPALDVPVRARVTVPTEGAATQDLTLRQPNLRGRVLAPDGTTALAGALVSLVDIAGDPVRHGRMRSRSDGGFGFSVPAGEYRLKVTPARHDLDLAARTTVDPVSVTGDHTAADPLVQDVTMLGTTLTGVVRDPNGDPVPDAHVHAYVEATQELVFSRADDEGRYGLRVPVGSVTVTLYPVGRTIEYVQTRLAFDVPELPHTRDLSFRAPNVTGRVVDQTGLPSARASLQVTGGLAEPGDWVHTAEANTDGRFALLLPPGDHRLLAEPRDQDDPTAIPTVQRITVADDATEVEIVLDAPTPPPYELTRLDVQLGGHQAHRVTDPLVSADGGVVAVRAESEGTGCNCLTRGERADAESPEEAIVLYDVATGEQEPLTAPNGSQVPAGVLFALDGDGSRVAFASSDPELVGDDGHDRLLVLDRADDQLLVVEPKPSSSPSDEAPELRMDIAPVVSGDGRTVAFVAEQWSPGLEWQARLEVVELADDGTVAGRELIPLPTDFDPRPALSQDGSTLAWLDHAAGGWQLQVRDLATGNQEDPREVWPGVSRWKDPYP